MPWDDETEQAVLADNPYLCPICGNDDCVPPSGDINSDVLFIGETPGEEEEDTKSIEALLSAITPDEATHLRTIVEIIMAKTTGGTTGLPTFTYSFTQHDYDRWNEGSARGYWLAGLRPGDRVLFCFPLSGGWAGSIIKEPLQDMGVLCLDLGAETHIEKIVQYGKMTRPMS